MILELYYPMQAAAPCWPFMVIPGLSNALGVSVLVLEVLSAPILNAQGFSAVSLMPGQLLSRWKALSQESPSNRIQPALGLSLRIS